ncbi:unnamed protein product [Symbiodinium sp. CCMP2456]|nr:unnamed protein product [Symbiodinium sp. CCMP2456]
MESALAASTGSLKATGKAKSVSLDGSRGVPLMMNAAPKTPGGRASKQTPIIPSKDVSPEQLQLFVFPSSLEHPEDLEIRQMIHHQTREMLFTLFKKPRETVEAAVAEWMWKPCCRLDLLWDCAEDLQPLSHLFKVFRSLDATRRGWLGPRQVARMAWAMEPQLGFQELALLFQCLGGKDGRIAPVDFCRAFQAVDAGVPASSTQGGAPVNVGPAFSPSRRGDGPTPQLSPQKEDPRAPLRGGGRFRPGFNLRTRQDAKRNLTSSSRETRTIQPLRGIRSLGLEADAAAALQDFVRRHKSEPQRSPPTAGRQEIVPSPRKPIASPAEVPKPAATAPSYSSEDFDGERSDGAYSDSFQNDYDSQSSGSSPREKSSFGECGCVIVDGLMPAAMAYNYTWSEVKQLLKPCFNEMGSNGGKLHFAHMQKIILKSQKERLQALLKDKNAAFKERGPKVPFQSKPQQALLAPIAKKQLNSCEEQLWRRTRLQRHCTKVAEMEDQNLQDQLVSNVILCRNPGDVDDRWDRYCAVRRVGKATYVKARNLPHSGYASMDDGLSDKHPGVSSLISAGYAKGPIL